VVDISIIIPTFNRASLLEATLNSIVAQHITTIDYEVIVVDNGSSDNTRAVCDDFRDKIVNFVYAFDAVPGQLTGRHKGLQLAKGDLLSYLDDDVVLGPGWINALSQLSAGNADIAIFGGPSVPQFEIKPPSWIERFWEATPYGGRMCLPLSLIDLERESVVIDPLYIFGLNFSIRKSVLLELAGFNPDCIPSNLQMYQGDGETGLAIKAGTKE